MTRHVAVLVGSLRRASFTRRVVEAMIALAPPSLAFDFVDIGSLPLFNQDFEEGTTPAAYVPFREAIRAADALLFATPEYNRSVPAALKNALDVGSRPYGASVWGGKPAAVVSVSPGPLGGALCNHALRQSLVYLDVLTMAQPEAYIGNAAKLVDDDGRVVEGSREMFQKFIDAFAAWIERASARKTFPVANVVVVGAQWGDEGKGKIVDWLSARADVVVRFQGGHNAGHTLVVGNQTYKLSLLPSGIVRGALSVIGNGVVFDPWHFAAEVAKLRDQGVEITPANLQVSELCPLILPLHSELDGLREDASGAGKIGTTRRGIGPAYEDKAGRRALRVADLAHLDDAGPQLDRLLAHHNALRTGFGVPPVDRAALVASLTEIAPFVLPFAAATWASLGDARRAGKRILFEGAQGVLLDVDHGTFPFVTSSNVVPGTAAAGSGMGPGAIGYVLGIVKAYTTRVGGGPFPTELDDAVGQRLGERGHEFGTVTGRKRRCGWFDAVLVRQAAQVSGIEGMALTKLDVLDGLDELMICTGYRLGDRTLDYFPAHAADQAAAVPVYERFDGWSESTMGARSWSDLPAQAIKYIRRIEELTRCPVALVSTSPERDDTILVRDPFID